MLRSAISQAKDLAQHKILYIEDDSDSRALIKRTLEYDGYKVSVAPSGASGLVQAKRQRPHLILLDIYMPDLDGHEVTRCLRQLDATKDTPILIISASSDAHDRRTGKNAGCVDYIIKPIDVDLISEQVAAYL
ncbi:MAG: response regulator [Chloroflexota bacterium]